MIKDRLTALFLPLLIILAAGSIAAVFLLDRGSAQEDADVAGSSRQDLRVLTLKAPGMFCVGCSASVEGYLGAIEGVKSVTASLATKKVEVVYDPSVVTQEIILSNQILDVYGKDVLGDEPFAGSTQAQTPSTTLLPQALSLKLQEAAFRVQELDDPAAFQDVFDAIDQAIARDDFQRAERLLDELLPSLEKKLEGGERT